MLACLQKAQLPVNPCMLCGGAMLSCFVVFWTAWSCYIVAAVAGPCVPALRAHAGVPFLDTPWAAACSLVRQMTPQLI
jgi:hypothetical protein